MNDRPNRSRRLFATKDDGTLTATIVSRRQQQCAAAAEIVYSPAWERIREIANEIKQKYGAPLPSKYGSDTAYQLYSIVRDILDEFLLAAEADAALAPAITGDEDE